MAELTEEQLERTAKLQAKNEELVKDMNEKYDRLVQDISLGKRELAKRPTAEEVSMSIGKAKRSAQQALNVT